jgi:F-type H+-transporting ATPase subunit epsilon
MHLSVTTPRGALVQTEVEEIAAPGALGEFGVLPGHLPFMSVLKPGVLAYRTKEGLRYLAVGEGILQVARTENGDRILALVDRGENAKDINRDAVAQELNGLDGELAKTKAETAAEVKVLLGKRAWAAARVDAANRASNH